MPGFHNPYNFVPVVSRPASGHPLADAVPAWHDRLHHDLWSGRIAVTMTVRTPLLLPEPLGPDDPSSEKLPPSEAGHQFFRTAVRTNDTGKYVHVGGSAVKGMLRATYEAITNSRLAVFRTADRLGFRYDETYPRRLVPAILRASAKEVVLLPGLRVNGRNAMGAARIHRYTGAHDTDGTETPLWTGQRLRHGQKLDAWLEFHGDDSGNGSWHVVACRPHQETGPFPPPSGGRPTKARVLGIVHAVNRGTAMKKHERLFIIRLVEVPPQRLSVEQAAPVLLRADQMRPHLLEDFAALIEHYRDQHTSGFGARDDIWSRKHPDGGPRKPDGKPVRPWDYLSGDPNCTSWSRHLYDVTALTPQQREARDLSETEIADQGPDTLPLRGSITCFAELRDPTDRNQPAPRDLSKAFCVRLVPVQITRALHDLAPPELLHEGTEPATALPQLSPADRTFGWVAQRPLTASPDDDPTADTTPTDDEGRDRAWASRLRIGPVRCTVPVQQALFTPKVPVALDILGAPKPSQGRFYVGQEGTNGVPTALGRRVEKETFFSADAAPPRRLRGRKVYPHHRRITGDADYWNADENRQAEYRRPQDTRDNQNRSMLDWVKPGVSFTFTIDVRNMSDAELGALLWMLDPQRLGTDHQPGHLRLGHGKPFGFGSVSLELNKADTDLRRGDSWAQDIAAFGAAEPTDDWSGLVDRFEEAIASVRGGSAVVEAVRRAATGYSGKARIHYPRTRPTKDPDGKNYEWFVANDQRDRSGRSIVNGYPLPPLGPADPPTLPYLTPRDNER